MLNGEEYILNGVNIVKQNAIEDNNSELEIAENIVLSVFSEFLNEQKTEELTDNCFKILQQQYEILLLNDVSCDRHKLAINKCEFFLKNFKKTYYVECNGFFKNLFIKNGYDVVSGGILFYGDYETLSNMISICEKYLDDSQNAVISEDEELEYVKKCIIIGYDDFINEMGITEMTEKHINNLKTYINLLKKDEKYKKTVEIGEDLLEEISELKIKVKWVKDENHYANKVSYKTFTTDDEYIAKYENEIYNFLNDGYLKFVGEPFATYKNGKKLRQKASFLKIAFNNDEWVAIAVYSDYIGGNKCVGICKNPYNDYLGKLGGSAVRCIIREDISNYKQFYWAEVSGKIVKIFEENDGIKIPSDYAQIILNKPYISIIDEFVYERPIGQDGVFYKKQLFGFNNEKTFNKIYSERKEYIDECIERIKRSRGLIEGVLKMNIEIDELNEWNFHMDVIEFFISEWNKGFCEYPKETVIYLQTSVDYLDKLFLSGTVPQEYGNDMKKLIDGGKKMLNSLSFLEIYQF